MNFSGLFIMGKLFAAGGKKIIVGLLALIVTLAFGLIALADGLLLVKVRKDIETIANGDFNHLIGSSII